MKEYPILFSAPMVRAILEGRKTMTRRVIKPQPSTVEGCSKHTSYFWRGGCYALQMYPDRSDILAHCPYGQPGDRLWVRETWMASGFDASVMENQYITYKADDFERHITRPCSTLWAQKVWRPSIFMPRWASRIFLEVTAIRIERVQDITGEDIEREGIDFPDGLSVERVGERFRPFMDLWDSINLVHGYGWDADPWVWAIEFKRVSA